MSSFRIKTNAGIHERKCLTNRFCFVLVLVLIKKLKVEDSGWAILVIWKVSNLNLFTLSIDPECTSLTERLQTATINQFDFCIFL